MGGGYPQQAPFPSGDPGPFVMGYPQPPGGGYGPPPRYAGWWQRVGALLLDSIIMEAPAIICIAIADNMHRNISYEVRNGVLYQISAPTAAGRAVAIIGMVLIAVGIITMIALKGGRGSVGQRIVGIRMIREHTGQPTGFWLALGRQILHIIDGLPLYLGYLWPAWDPKKQTFADKIVSTVVFRTR